MFVKYGKAGHRSARSVTNSQQPKYYVMPELQVNTAT
jgi:hypothetical protein